MDVVRRALGRAEPALCAGSDAAGYAVHAVSESAIGLMIAMLRRIVLADATVRTANMVSLSNTAGSAKMASRKTV